MSRLPRAFIAPPLAIAALVAVGYALRFGAWGRAWNLVLAGAAFCWLAWLQRGRWRDSAVTLASIAFCLAAVEALAIALQSSPIDRNTPGYSVADPDLGWRPGAPGTYHHVKQRRADAGTIFDVRYTIVPGPERKVDSDPAAPAIIFLGDSTTFGTGVNDADTLPQAFADATDRRFHVRNLAMSGYGPQQVLRRLELEPRLAGTRAFVFQTASFHAERASCWASFMLRAPRYTLQGGTPTYAGKCYENWWIAARSLFTASATYQRFLAPLIGQPSRAEIDLFIATLIQADRTARARHGAPLVILYMSRLPTSQPGDYLARAGLTEADIMARLRAAGLTVVDGTLDPAAFPTPIAIPGDGHPTGTANRARAALLAKALP